jgi:methyl-accepting chemotaxis protein
MSSALPPGTARTADARALAPDVAKDLATDVVRLVRLMTSVAEETRLIALNASLEAARAGHEGPRHALAEGQVTELPHPLPRPVDAGDEVARVAAELLAVTTGLAMYLPGPPV